MVCGRLPEGTGPQQNRTVAATGKHPPHAQERSEKTQAEGKAGGEQAQSNSEAHFRFETVVRVRSGNGRRVAGAGAVKRAAPGVADEGTAGASAGTASGTSESGMQRSGSMAGCCAAGPFL